MSYDFQITTHGKWILAGEHAVLRGHGAIVFPILDKQLTLSYKATHSEFSTSYEGLNNADMHLLFLNVLERGQQLLGRSLHHLHGHFHLKNNIPVGVGLGASAALCFAVASWFAASQELAEPVYDFAKNLEHLFHGKSSGVDIAGASAKHAIYFQQNKISPIKQAWKPIWYLSSCEQVGITACCIKQVQELWANNADSAAIIDEKMQHCTMNARLAIEKNEPNSLNALAQSMQQASDCFKQWGLLNEPLQQHMQALLNAGALAVKPTGSGKGGYVASLWDHHPSTLSMELIAV